MPPLAHAPDRLTSPLVLALLLLVSISSFADDNQIVNSGKSTSDESLVQGNVGFDILPGSDDVYNWQTGEWETLASGPNYAPNM